MFHSDMREKPHAAGGQLSIMGLPEMLANPARWLIPAVLFAGAALFYFGDRTPPRPVTEPSRPQAILASVTTSLGLAAERRGDALVLRWNRESPAITSAVTGILVLQTAADREDLVLSREDLRSGRFIHRSTANLFNIRLHVIDGNDNQTTDSMDFFLQRKSGGRTTVTSRQISNSPAAPGRPGTPAGIQRRIATGRVGDASRDGTIMARRHQSDLSLIRPPKPAVAGGLPLDTPPSIEPAFLRSPIPLPGLLEQAPSRPRFDPALDSTAQAVTASPVRRVATGVPLFKKRHHDSDFEPPTPIRTSSPEIPANLRQGLTREISVDVKVYVNSSGEVQYAELLSNGMGPERDIASFAVFESRRWKFHPAQSGGRPSDGEVILHFRFSPVPAPELRSGK